MRADPELEARVARWLRAHHGHIRRADAVALGHTRHTLDRARRHGLLEPANNKVLRLAGAPRTAEGDLYAAVHGCVDGALASHLSAAALYGWCRHPTLPHVTVPYGAGTRGVAVVHRSRVQPVDATIVGVIPATTPARTVVDCAAVLARRELGELVDVAMLSGRVQRTAIFGAIDRSGVRPGRRGIPDLRAELDIWDPQIEHDSVAEARLFRHLTAWGYPTPVTLYVVRADDGSAVAELDVAWPAFRFALEYDSPEFHEPRRWARDERRCGGAAALGWTILPVDKSDLHPGGHARLRAALDRHLRERPPGPRTDAA